MAANDNQQIVKKQPANVKQDSKKSGDNIFARFFKRIGKALEAKVKFGTLYSGLMVKPDTLALSMRLRMRPASV